MSQPNGDLQATHQILSILEKSKSKTENLLDQLPGVLVVMSMNGTILRGNIAAARHLGLDHESLTGSHLSGMFKTETWHTFEAQLQKLAKNRHQSLQFELPIDLEVGQSYPCLWHIQPFDCEGDALPDLYTVTAQDLSEIRRAEKQLSDFFTSIPLGILTVSRDGKIEPKYSAYLEWLLGTDQIADLDLKTVLFVPGWERLTKNDRDAVNAINSSLSETTAFFDCLKDLFPVEIYYPVKKDGAITSRYLGISYQAVSSNERIEKLLLVVEDRTSRVLAREQEREARQSQERNLIRLDQLKKNPPTLLPLLMKELMSMLNELQSALSERNQGGVVDRLHALKGNARIAGFDLLKDQCHRLESEIKDLNLDWEAIQLAVLLIKAEADEIDTLYEALIARKKPVERNNIELVHGLVRRYQFFLSRQHGIDVELATKRIALALEASSRVGLESLQELILLKAQETARQLGKQVTLCPDWGRIRVSEEQKNALSECLLHLLTNSISHGFEKGGEITFSFIEENEILRCTFRDNGRGIDINRVKGAAVRKNLISFEASLVMDRTSAMQLIFQRDLSTAEELTEVSGRGIGLDAVRSNLIKLGGEITVGDNPGGGTLFQFQMSLSRFEDLQKRCLPFSEFAEFLRQRLLFLSAEENLTIEFDGFDGTSQSIFLDPSALALAITSQLGHFSATYSISSLRARLETTPDGFLDCVLSVNSGRPQTTFVAMNAAEFEHAAATSLGMILRHQGSLSKRDKEWRIRFGHFVDKELQGLDAI